MTDEFDHSPTDDGPGPVDRVDDARRERTYGWHDVHDAGGRHADQSGLAAMREVLEGRRHISPGAHTLGIRLDAVEEGVATMRARPGEWACNNGGTVHGGIVSGWVDSALGYATATVLDEGVGYNTLDLTVRYIRALRLADTPATVVAEVEHCGRSTAVLRARVLDSSGRLVASGSGVMMLFRP